MPHECCSFGGFELDLSAYELRREGGRIRLERQPMDLLILLVERRGELVLRSDIVARLWPKDVFVDVDTGINTAIRKIRAALGDSIEAPAFVETVPGKGYRFIAAVDRLPSEPERRADTRPQARPSLRMLSRAGIACLAALVALFTAWYRSIPAPPRVTGSTQITSDELPKSGPVTDGSRLYFNETRPTDLSVLAEVAAGGGEVRPIDTPFAAPSIVDISPDGSELLVLGEHEPLKGPTHDLWTIPVVGGTPRRVGDVRALEAVWSSDGLDIAYTNGSTEVLAVKADGSGSRRIWAAPGLVRWPAWSRDGRVLRVTVIAGEDVSGLWEVGRDGQGAHRLLPTFDSPACCGRWTSDGRYFVFDAFDRKHHTPDVWVLRERTAWFSRVSGEPVRLTQGPINFFNPIPSRDGRRIFAVGEKERGQLVRYDPRSSQFLPYLSGISATEVAFSSDGQWMAYVAFPDRALWRSRIDGTDRLQLTRAPLEVETVRWSPDGQRLVFAAEDDLTPSTYFISMAGGLPERVPVPEGWKWVAESWSPDGATLAWGAPVTAGAAVQLLDLATRRFSKVPGSEGLCSPRFSPDGRELAALSTDGRRLLLYDLASGHWRELLAGDQLLGFPDWSKDGRFLFVSEGASRVRLAIADGRPEVVASFEGLPRPANALEWAGTAPDDSVITLRDLSVREIFAFDWEAP